MSMDRIETAPGLQPVQNGDAGTPLLELRNVSKQYGLNKVLNNVSFYVGHAEIVAIEGIDSPDKLVGSLSGGQKQAVAIARAVHFKRTLLMLDEPTSALAVRATEALFEYLRSLRTQGLSSVLVTHNLYDAYRICDRFIVMGHGEVVFQARQKETSVEELTEHVSRG